MVRDNPVKAKLARGEPALGAFLTSGDPVIAEVVALAGFDCLMIDHEHGFGDLRAGLHCLQALSALPCAGLFRAPSNDPVAIKRLLDIGAEGIMVPSVTDAAEAEAAVAAIRYPPRGVRGAAYPIARCADYGFAADAYLSRWQGEILTILQIESAAAVEAVPEIAAVDGVDMLFVGPMDLSGSIGKLGRFDDAEVQALVRRAERAVIDSGRIPAALPSLGRTPAQMVADGIRCVIGPADLAMLAGAARGHVEVFRSG